MRNLTPVRYNLRYFVFNIIQLYISWDNKYNLIFLPSLETLNRRTFEPFTSLYFVVISEWLDCDKWLESVTNHCWEKNIVCVPEGTLILWFHLHKKYFPREISNSEIRNFKFHLTWLENLTSVYKERKERRKIRVVAIRSN